VNVRQALLTVLATAAIGLALVGTAAATTRVETTSSAWFISRGDVLSVVGKDALVSNPVITHVQAWSQTWTCGYDDSSSVSISAVVHDAVLYNAQARFAPGSGTITGYLVGAPFTAFSDPTPCASTRAGHVLAQQTMLSSTLQSDLVLYQNVPLGIAFPG
jgi:hypothetical protein